MNYQIRTYQLDTGRWFYRIMFDKFAIEPHDDYARKITAERKARETINRLLDWQRRPEMIINVCNGEPYGRRA